jgi:tRNA threonylcarbamoyladenosine biosynthesis protein TsaB
LTALLALDTATHTASVALVTDDGAVRAERTSQVSTHSEVVLSLIDQVLAGIPVGELAAIACGAGPGSFTGLRIGLATAKGLCFASGRPLVLVPSLAALATVAPPGVLAVGCLDARKGEVFLAPYIDGEAVAAEQAARPNDVAEVVEGFRRAASGREVVLVGDAVSRYPELASVGRWISGTPHASAVGRLAWKRLARGETDDVDKAAPRYVRAPDITLPKP